MQSTPNTTEDLIGTLLVLELEKQGISMDEFENALSNPMEKRAFDPLNIIKNLISVVGSVGKIGLIGSLGIGAGGGYLASKLYKDVFEDNKKQQELIETKKRIEAAQREIESMQGIPVR